MDAHRERDTATPSEAIRIARRTLQYLNGLLFCTLGGIALVAGWVVHYYPNSPSRWAVVLLLPLAWLALRSMERRRRDHGPWAAENRESLTGFLFRWIPQDPDQVTVEPVFLRTTWRVIVWSTLALVAAFAIQFTQSGELPKSLYYIMVAVGGLHLMMYGAWLAITLGLAEHLLVIAWFSAGAAYILTTQSGATVVYGGGLILLGSLLHLRWIQFAGQSETEPLAVGSIQ